MSIRQRPNAPNWGNRWQDVSVPEPLDVSYIWPQEQRKCMCKCCQGWRRAQQQTQFDTDDFSDSSDDDNDDSDEIQRTGCGFRGECGKRITQRSLTCWTWLSTIARTWNTPT